MSEYIRLQANGEDAFPDASSQNTYRDNGTSVEASLVALEGQITTLGGVAGEAKTLAEQNSVKIATAEQEISDINSSLINLWTDWEDVTRKNFNGNVLYSKSDILGLVKVRISGTTKSEIAHGSSLLIGVIPIRPLNNTSVLLDNNAKSKASIMVHYSGEVYVSNNTGSTIGSGLNAVNTIVYPYK